MTNRITQADITTATAKLDYLFKLDGTIPADAHIVEPWGSKLNGIAFRVMHTGHEGSTGHSTVHNPVSDSSGFIGMTKSEAFEKMQIMVRVQCAILEAKGMEVDYEKLHSFA